MSVADYPNAPGHRHIETSVAAAEAIASSCGHLQRLALRAIRAVGGRGLTTQELAAATDVDFASIQPRTSELRRLGLIRDSGMRRLNRNGKKAIVWVAEVRHG